MSTATAEITELDINLDETPPCGIKLTRKMKEPCGAPSVVRIKTACSCGYNPIIFVCQMHLDKLRDNNIKCGGCGYHSFHWIES